MRTDVVVIGGGIAGSAVAYFLGRAGLRVTVVDGGAGAASLVPSALLNPVRGQSGTVSPRALEGLRLTWALIAELEAAGHRVPHGQSGVYRPVPDAQTRARFERNLPPELSRRWLAPEEVPGLAPGWHRALHLPEGGWVDGPALCAALLGASGGAVVREWARAWSADAVELDTGALLEARAVVFCGGSAGVSAAGEAATHRAGTLLTLDRAVSESPLSYGAYLAPSAAGGVLGATFEASTAQFPGDGLPLASLHWLLGKGEALSDLSGVRVTGRWSGSRLSGLRSGLGEQGVWRLTGLSSKGFLMGPLLAQEVTQGVASALGASRGG